MREVTLEELHQIASNSREAIWEEAKGQEKDVKLYLHWTAGKYYTKYEDYHINIDGDGRIFVSVDDLSTKLSHTYMRNTGSVGIALDCAYGAGSSDLGEYPPTAVQIETMAKVICVVAEALWLTIDKDHVMTHGEAANNEDGDFRWHKPYAWWNDGYGDGDTRGDLEYLGTDESPSYNPYAEDGSRGGDVLRGKANWYKGQGLVDNL